MLYSFIKLNSTANNQIDFEKSILFNYCDSKIRQYLPNFKENKILIDFVTQMLVVTSKILNIKNFDGREDDTTKIFLNQISMNNDRNFIALLNLFLPYIDDKNDFYNQKNIKGIIHLIEEKKDTNMSNKSKFCNFIYDHSTLVNFIGKYNDLENA